jgi:hypothetical protein
MTQGDIFAMKNEWYFTNQTVDRHEARRLELIIEQETGLILNNPFYDGAAKEVSTLDTIGKTQLSEDEIVGMDLRKIRDSVGIVAMMTADQCIGSAMEIAIAAFAWGKPVYVIARSDLFRHHPWIKYFASRIFDDVHAFIEYAKENLK